MTKINEVIIPYFGKHYGENDRHVVLLQNDHDLSFFEGEKGEESNLNGAIRIMKALGGVDLSHNHNVIPLSYTSTEGGEPARYWMATKITKSEFEIAQTQSGDSSVAAIPIESLWNLLWQIPDREKGSSLADFWINTLFAQIRDAQ